MSGLRAATGRVPNARTTADAVLAVSVLENDKLALHTLTLATQQPRFPGVETCGRLQNVGRNVRQMLGQHGLGKPHCGFNVYCVWGSATTLPSGLAYTRKQAPGLHYAAALLAALSVVIVHAEGWKLLELAIVGIIKGRFCVVRLGGRCRAHIHFHTQENPRLAALTSISDQLGDKCLGFGGWGLWWPRLQLAGKRRCAFGRFFQLLLGQHVQSLQLRGLSQRGQ